MRIGRILPAIRGLWWLPPMYQSWGSVFPGFRSHQHALPDATWPPGYGRATSHMRWRTPCFEIIFVRFICGSFLLVVPWLLNFELLGHSKVTATWLLCIIYYVTMFVWLQWEVWPQNQLHTAATSFISSMNHSWRHRSLWQVEGNHPNMTLIQVGDLFKII